MMECCLVTLPGKQTTRERPTRFSWVSRGHLRRFSLRISQGNVWKRCADMRDLIPYVYVAPTKAWPKTITSTSQSPFEGFVTESVSSTSEYDLQKPAMIFVRTGQQSNCSWIEKLETGKEELRKNGVRSCDEVGRYLSDSTLKGTSRVG